MRVLICGSRTWSNGAAIARVLDELIAEHGPNIVVIEGEARGADSLARDLALERRLKVERYPADWERYGRGAGPVRNKQMLTEGKPDRVYAFSLDLSKSRGTANMVEQAKKAGVPVLVFSA